MTYIVSTQENGMVAVTAPAPRFMAAVTHGGFGRVLDPAGNPQPVENETEDRQIENMMASGYDADFSSRYVTALVRGGETDAGGLDLIRKRHLSSHRNHARIDFAALPDRFFRDAWRQDEAAGTVFVELEAAKLVFARKLIAEKADAVATLLRDIEAMSLAGRGSSALEAAHASLKAIDLKVLADDVARAETPQALRALWPAALADA